MKIKPSHLLNVDSKWGRLKLSPPLSTSAPSWGELSKFHDISLDHSPRECWFDWATLKNMWERKTLELVICHVLGTSGLSSTLLLLSEWIMGIPRGWHPGMTPKAIVFLGTTSSPLVFSALRPCWVLCTNEKNRPFSCSLDLVPYGLLVAKPNGVSLLSNLALKISISYVPFPSCHPLLQISLSSKRLSSSYYQGSHWVPRTNQYRR